MIKNFENIKEEAERFYKTLGEIYCPYFGEKIVFNTKGLKHIKFKDWNKPRIIKEQFVRLKLLHLAPEIIKKSHTLQEFYETLKLERQIINSRWEERMVRVRYYGFVAILNNIRVKIIIKEIIGGKKFFWSIIPFWKTNRDKFSDKIKKILHEGDLENQ